MTRVSRDVISGMTEAQAAETARNEKPMLVYVYDDNDDNDDNGRGAIAEDRAFLNDKVAIVARYFDCLRIDADSAKDDRALSRKIRRLPALVYLRPNFDVAAVHSGRFSANKVYGALSATMRKDYTNNVSKVLRKQKAIMKQRVSCDRDRVRLARLEEDIADEKSRGKRAKLVKERDALQKKIDAAERRLDGREAELYKLAPRNVS